MRADEKNTQSCRLGTGGLVDRTQSLRFVFDGKTYTGHPGDTLASALLANGVRLVGRSFKYHRPRGILSAGPEEPNALVELRAGARREPNTRATTIELFDGLEARSQNRWPSLAFDVMSGNALLGPILSAGFYYKTFMWPASFWEKLYEPLIRRAAGLGRAAETGDPDHYEKTNIHCDVLVIGSGPAGLSTALSAGRTGARVLLVEQDFALGGAFLSERRKDGGLDSTSMLGEMLRELGKLPEVTVLKRTSLFASYDQKTFAAVEQVSDHLPEPAPFEPRQRLWRIIAKQTVLAAGRIERPMIFSDNDRPGVMLAGAVRTYINRFGVLPGHNAVIFARGDEALTTLLDLHAAGMGISAIVDPSPKSMPPLIEAAQRLGVPLHCDAVVTRAHGGIHGVQSVEIANNGRNRQISCDLVAMSGGWNPTLHLTSHLGHKPIWNETLAAFVPDQLPEGMQVAGAAAGHFTLDMCLATGALAGAKAAEAAGFSAAKPLASAAIPQSKGERPLWRVTARKDKPLKGKAFVDFQNDVTTADIELAHREGFSAIEHVKRYTTLGMATDQGKTSNVNALGIIAEITAKDMAEIGTTTFRPPFAPVTLGAFAGHARGKHLRPTRLPPTHAWSTLQGAIFMEAGVWMRPAYYPRPGEDWFASATREARCVREAVGFCDVSTLGKIDVQGKDAATFLDRLYTGMISTLGIGKVRYGLMLREDGFVFDDGTAARLGAHHWLITTTTANAARVMQHMEFAAQVLWADLDVKLSSVTDQWAQVAIAGPMARKVLENLVDPGHDISNAGLPYMGTMALSVCGGARARLFRISFSGELGYELAVPARYGNALMRAIARAGAQFGIQPYGLEALSMLRVEKGHAAGSELNGQTTARDLGLQKMVSTKKDFIGKMLANRPAMLDPARPILIGVKPSNPADPISAGAHFIEIDAAPVIENDLGFITSSTISPVFGHSIALGLLSNGIERIGTEIIAHDPIRSRSTRVTVCHPVFYDPEGVRLRG